MVHNLYLCPHRSPSTFTAFRRDRLDLKAKNGENLNEAVERELSDLGEQIGTAKN